SGFTERRLHPILRRVCPHWGVDYAAPAGTPVMAACSGRVTFAGWSGGFGRTIALSHGADMLTQYGHLSGFARGLRVGTFVSQGEIIGYIGSTGLATGPHLDFRLRKDGRYVDPTKLVDHEPSRVLAGSDRDRFEVVKDAWSEQMRRVSPGSKTTIEDGRG